MGRHRVGFISCGERKATVGRTGDCLMGKKKRPGHAKRLDPVEHGVDPEAILREIEVYLGTMTHAEVAERAGLARGTVALMRGGFKKPSMAALAALAKAAGGRLDVRFIPPRKKKSD